MNDVHGSFYTLCQFLTNLENDVISGYVHKHVRERRNGEVMTDAE